MKRPPYTWTLRRTGTGRSWWVLVGSEAWSTGRAWAEQQHRVFTVCPPLEDPLAFDWSTYRHAPPPVGLVRCGDVDGEQLRTLVEALLAAGSPRLYDLHAGIAYDREVPA